MESITTTCFSDDTKFCELCNQCPRRYKCPRCGIFTCSVDCVKNHKQQTGCNGQRDRTKFIPAKELNDLNLRNDFHFLEDVIQSKDVARRTFVKDGGGSRGCYNTKSFRTHRKSSSANSLIHFSGNFQNLDGYSKGVKNLFHAAKDRGTKLFLLPQGMTKRLSNTSHIDPQSKRIMWRVNIGFILDDSFVIPDLCAFDSFVPTSLSHPVHMSPKVDPSLNPESPYIEYQAFCLNSSLIGVCLNNIDENRELNEIIQNVVQNLPPGTPLRHLLRNILPIVNELRCIMRVIPSPGDNPLFTEIMCSMSLKSALTGQSIIEFPTFYISSPELLSKFRLRISQVDSPLGTNGKRKFDDDQEEEIYAEDKRRCPERMVSLVQDDDEAALIDGTDEDEEEYDDFMQEFLTLQSVGIEELKTLINCEEHATLN